MSAIMAFNYNAPPPTSNTLDSCQKSRLIRSTRKLGEVLGTTPQLLEEPSPISLSSPIARNSTPRYDRKRRQGSIFEFPPSLAPFTYDSTSSASSSVSSLALPRSSIESTSSEASTRSLPTLPATKSFAKHVRDKSRSKGKPTPLPTPLVLRLNAVALPPSDPRVQPPVSPDTTATRKTATTLRATKLSTSAMPLTPTTPRTPVTPTVAETRRKRLAKLKRTLGENIPQELIMPFRTRAQHLSPVVSSTPTPVSAKPWSSQPVQHTQTMPVVRPSKGSRRRSVSVDFGNPHALASTPKSTSPIPSTRQPPENSSIPETVETPVRRSSRVWVTGAGTWTGEWNRKDIREVQHQLRTLRIR